MKKKTGISPDVTIGSSSHLVMPTARIDFWVSRVNHFPGGQLARLPARTKTPEGV